MPSHLHPRSRLTSSLFATTLVASFLVVGLPHVLPCPAPRIAYADGEMNADGTARRRRRRKCVNIAETSKESSNETKIIEEAFTDDEDIAGEQTRGNRARRECPVPKPSGIVGQILGFKKEQNGGGNGKGSPPP
jgi:cytochrome c oxidase assembly factor 2